MPETVLVQTRIDADIEARAAQVLEDLGLTVHEAVRILLTRTAEEGALPMEIADDSGGYDAWFRTQVQEALADPAPGIPSDDVETYFDRRRAELIGGTTRRGQ